MPFGGATYEKALDHARLSTQLERVLTLMADSKWRTLGEIARAIGGSEASVSARLRDFRKVKFGAHEVQRRRRGYAPNGLHEYRLLPNGGLNGQAT